MAQQVPNGTRFIGIATSVDLTERKSSVLNKQTEPFTIEDIVLSVPAGPAGPQGVQGPAGPLGPVGPAGLTWRRYWVSGTSYVANDAVGYNGATWFCILATSGTTTPNLDTTHWALLASQGAQGIQGVQGPTGAQGPAGNPATQTLQETVDLGNTITSGSYVTTLSANSISNEKFGDGVSSTLSYEGLFLLKNTKILTFQAPDTLTDNRNIKLPNASGTVALLSDIPSGTVPTLQQVTNTGNTIVSGGFQASLFAVALGVEQVGVSSAFISYDGVQLQNTANNIKLTLPATLTADRIITLPNATGTIALNTQLPTVAGNYANDAAAAAGGVLVGNMYHTAGVVKIRLA